MKLSIIIPTLNESGCITSTLVPLQPLRAAGHEIVVVDGGSSDDTVSLATPLADHLSISPPGRARQMNAGAAMSSGEILLFLHADTFLPPSTHGLLIQKLADTRRRWGRYDVRLSGEHPLLRVIEIMMNLRSRWTEIATGDQAIFVEKDLFNAVGGFPPLPLMEDIALSRTLKRHGPPLCLREYVISSSRRWETRGMVRTLLLMWRLRLAYFFGSDPRHLVRLYYSDESK